MIVSRFAPAPTGFLHLGHVVNAVYVWGITRARGGRVLLRIEDHDRQRSRPAFEAAILEDLDWLGFAPDEAPVRQSDRGGLYVDALERLRAAGLVYACECSRADVADVADIADVARRPHPTRLRDDASAGLAEARLAAERAEVGELRYPGTCADKHLADGAGRGLRVRIEPAAERFIDLRHGPQTQRPSEQCGDLLVKDRDGNWTYQFAATVDDHLQDVTHVIRGDDLLVSTGRQIQLARLLGRCESPQFLHHALIMKTPGQKLSKSDGDTGVGDLRARGWAAPEVIGHAAFLVGLIPESRPIAADAVSSII